MFTKTNQYMTLIFVIFTSTCLHAQPGSFDPSFNNDGWDFQQSGEDIVFGLDLIVDSSNYIYSASINGSKVTLLKYSDMGVLDTNFGVNGKLLLPKQLAGTVDVGLSLG